MDDPQRRRTTGENPNTPSKSITTKIPSASASARTKSVSETILYILHQILDLPVTAILLGLGFILPELKDWITSFGMGKNFDPERDIGSLEGKVILVTGGMQSCPYSRSLHSH
jgi:hypothetical protein